MELVEGRVYVDVEPPADVPRFEDVDAFVDRLDAIGEEHNSAIQALDARYVAGTGHVTLAVELARRAHDRDDAIARDRSVEILLYAAGRRQIERALEMGVGRGETTVVVAIEGGDEPEAAAAVGDLVVPAEAREARDPSRIRAYFDIGDRELAATDAPLEALVCERVALLVVEK